MNISAPLQRADLTVVILTRDERLHIRRCLESIGSLARQMVVVDSGSVDETANIAESMGAVVLVHRWRNYASQFNWALDNASIDTTWVMRLDADEYLDDVLRAALPVALRDAAPEVSGFVVKRPTTFLGRRIEHGGMAPSLLRVWRHGWGHCEERWMDEHILLRGGLVRRLPGRIVDHNLNTITWWVEKHNRYATRETVDLLQVREVSKGSVQTGLTLQARLKRWLKIRVYARLPLGMRPFLFWIYRVVFQLGFLDGGRGLMFHTLQGLWYRLLVDAKLLEIKHATSNQGSSQSDSIHARLQIDLDTVNNKRQSQKMRDP